MPDPIVLPRTTRSRGTTARSSTWWGRAVVRSFEELTIEESERVAARALARAGRLGAIMVLDAMASAVVDPGQDTAVMAQIKVHRLPPDGWATFAREASRESGFLAALEVGELPAELVEHADEAGVELLPGPAEIDTACECAAWADPCVHALALLYQLAWHIDRDPYVLLLLRGRTREALIEEVTYRTPMGHADSASARAARILALAENAPTGHGLADAAVAAYDEDVARLL